MLVGSGEAPEMEAEWKNPEDNIWDPQPEKKQLIFYKLISNSNWSFTSHSQGFPYIDWSTI